MQSSIGPRVRTGGRKGAGRRRGVASSRIQWPAARASSPVGPNLNRSTLANLWRRGRPRRALDAHRHHCIHVPMRVRVPKGWVRVVWPGRLCRRSIQGSRVAGPKSAAGVFRNFGRTWTLKPRISTSTQKDTLRRAGLRTSAPKIRTKLRIK